MLVLIIRPYRGVLDPISATTPSMTLISKAKLLVSIHRLKIYLQNLSLLVKGAKNPITATYQSIQVFSRPGVTLPL